MSLIFCLIKKSLGFFKSLFVIFGLISIITLMAFEDWECVILEIYSKIMIKSLPGLLQGIILLSLLFFQHNVESLKTFQKQPCAIIVFYYYYPHSNKVLSLLLISFMLLVLPLQVLFFFFFFCSRCVVKGADIIIRKNTCYVIGNTCCCCRFVIFNRSSSSSSLPFLFLLYHQSSKVSLPDFSRYSNTTTMTDFIRCVFYFFFLF